MMKRLIVVAKEHRQYLEAAALAAAGAAGRDVYEAIKKHLTAKGVPHKDVTMAPREVPAHSTYWHA